MRNPGHELALQRGQAALDLANPDVQDFMFASVNDLISAYPGIRFVKWDCNSNINNPYSPYLGADSQGNMLNAYNNGYLGVMQRLVEGHPGGDFQACAAGGGRANFGAMRYSQTFWPSDATDPRYQFEPSVISPVSCRPWPSPLMSLMPAASRSTRNSASMNFVSRDLKKALVIAYQIGSASKPISYTAPVSGLEPNLVYEAVEINLPEADTTPRLAPGVERRQTGAAWMKKVIPVVFTRQFDSAAIVLDSKGTSDLPAPQ